MVSRELRGLSHQFFRKSFLLFLVVFAVGSAVGQPTTSRPFPATEIAFAGTKVCACPAKDPGSLVGLLLDGHEVPTTVREDGVFEFELPTGLNPGRHVVATSARGDFAEIEVIAVEARLDREKLHHGGSTTLALEVQGSSRSIPLEFVNNSQDIVTLEGGSRVYLQTSGGENNAATVRVKARRKGDFDIQWQLGLPPCPCDPEVSAKTFAGDACPRTDLSCLQPRPAPPLENPVEWKDEGNAAVVAGRSSKGQAWQVVFGKKGRGETRINAVATISEKEVVAVGWTTAKKLWGLKGWNKGGRDAFVARIDPRTGKLLGGRLIGCPGNQELTGVASDQRGELMVVGTTDRTVPNLGKDLGAMTQTLPSVRGGIRVPAFVSRLSKNAKSEEGRRYLGGLPVKRPRIWMDCKGVPVVGAPALAEAECSGGWPDPVYRQSQEGVPAFESDIASDHGRNADPNFLGSPPGGWGFHALRWKDHHGDNPNPISLVWPPINQEPRIPKNGVSCSLTSDLNAREGSPSLSTSIFQDSALSPVDPGGSWQCGATTNPAELALYSSFLMKEWGTPVYTHFRVYEWFHPDQPWLKYPGVVEKSRFHPICPSSPTAYAGQGLDGICDFGPAKEVKDLKCSPNPFIPGVSGSAGYMLRFERLTGGGWDPADNLVPRVWGPIGVPTSDWYVPGEYVFDPPDGSEPRMQFLQAASREVASRLAQRAPVTVVRRAPGVPACVWRQTADIPFDP